MQIGEPLAMQAASLSLGNARLNRGRTRSLSTHEYSYDGLATLLHSPVFSIDRKDRGRMTCSNVNNPPSRSRCFVFHENAPARHGIRST
eukprot:1729343-Amphidinium_carterae.2